MDIKVIILDIDGTLVNSEKELTEKTKNSLIEAQKSGIRLVLASGRPFRGMIKLAKELGMYENKGIIVCFNGARIVDLETGNIIYDKTMSVDDAKSVLRHAKNFNLIPMIVKGEYTYVNNVYNCMIKIKNQPVNIVDIEAHRNNYKLCEVDDLEDFVDFNLNKILLAGDEDYIKEVAGDLKKPFEGKLSSMFTSSFFYEFTALNIDKAEALKKVLIQEEGYKVENLMAFGDSQNDKSMVELVGTGVAMGNATEEVKAVAQIITNSNDEDGISKVVDKLLKGTL